MRIIARPKTLVDAINRLNRQDENPKTCLMCGTGIITDYATNWSIETVDFQGKTYFVAPHPDCLPTQRMADKHPHIPMM